jgi:hypothetical protein
MRQSCLILNQILPYPRSGKVYPTATLAPFRGYISQPKTQLVNRSRTQRSTRGMFFKEE